MDKLSQRVAAKETSLSCRAWQVGALLHKTEAAAALLKSIQEKAALLQQVRAFLPSDIQPHCKQASIQDGVLTLSVDSPAWSSRLRLQTPALIGAIEAVRPEAPLAPEALLIRKLRIRVLPVPPAPADHDRETVRPASPAAAQLLKQAAEDVANHELARSLTNLAITLSPTKSE